ncbi:DUF4349 domain-containing protein [Cohnella thermotolerans]|uniref:DUF4349 domain-containing protein n=1 Tax=Cohnella thermotolerans TaxID=329858 RepID=UPI000411ED12|nr:DUF4349 domain-containing protein [Cohnella thermotolerans]
MKGKWRQAAAGMLAVMTLALALTACSAGSSDDSNSAAAPEAAKGAASEALGDAASKTSLNAQYSENAASDAKSAANASAAAGSGLPPSAAAETGAGIGAIADADAGYNRKMIYSASVVLKAANFAQAEERVSNAIFQARGFIVQFADTRNGDEIGSTYVIKVPSSGFSSFLAALKAIPNEGFERQVQGNDVTEEYVDLESRLKAKQAVEARLLAFMDKATKSDDLVRFSNELGSVQEEIEQIKGRMRYLDQNVAYSTVNLKLYEAAEGEKMAAGGKEAKGLGDKLGDALSGSLRALGNIGEGILTVLAALLPVLIVAAAIGLPIGWGVRRSRSNRRLQAAEKRKRWNAPQPDADGESLPAPAERTRNDPSDSAGEPDPAAGSERAEPANPDGGHRPPKGGKALPDEEAGR